MTVTVILGCTFDPVHEGHLQTAKSIADLFVDCRVILIPCYIPPHRAVPGVSAGDRLAMVNLAIADDPRLASDDIELRRKGVSFTIDTLRRYRHELGPEASLVFVMGSDAWPTLPTWHDWQEMTDYAHLMIVERPGVHPPEPAVLGEWAAERNASGPEDLAGSGCGQIWRARLTQVEVSATAVRDILRNGGDAAGLVPAPVLSYITEEQLYLALNDVDG